MRPSAAVIIPSLGSRLLADHLDNIGYADLSDFFYIWLRRSLQPVFPKLLSTMLVPKNAELIASPFRFGGSKEKAERFFEDGFRRAFACMRERQHPDYPLTVFYAFKQAEEDEESAEEVDNGATRASTGWETMLEGLLQAGFTIDGTWPMRTERASRTRDIGSNALATSIVLVCRPRATDAPKSDRAKFTAELKRELPKGLFLKWDHAAAA
jgi:putative DNA methylase